MKPICRRGRRDAAVRREFVVVAAMFACLAALPNERIASAQSSDDPIEFVQARVVKIYGAGGIANLHSYGTGFIVSSEGHIATVWSHVLDGDVVTVVLEDGRRYYGEVLGAEPHLDLALLKIDAEGLDHFDLSQGAEAGPGTRVLAFSNMFQVATGDEPLSVVHGVVAARTNLTARRGRFEVPYHGPVYIVDAVTNNPGAAGGVLTTRDGRLLGMIGRELRNADSNTWINYAIPITELAPTIEAIRTDDFSAIETPEVDDDPRRYDAADFGIVLIPDVVYRTPAYVDAVRAESPAEAVDLRPNDLIVFVGNELVQSIRVLERLLGRLEAEDDLTLIVRRGNQLVSVTMRVPRKTEP
jgi:serine protease Do